MSFISNLFGGDDTPAVKPVTFQGGGLGTKFDEATGRLTVAPTAERTGLVQGAQGAFGGLSSELAGLRPSVAPGFSALRDAQLGQIESARTAAVGNLRENLARRRVLGSSFGADALTRAESEFAGQKQQVEAQSFLQELELTNNLINQQFNAAAQKFMVGLQDLNLQADVGAKLSAQMTDVMARNAQFQQQLAAQNAAGAGKLFGTLAGAAVGSVFGNPLAGASIGSMAAGGSGAFGSSGTFRSPQLPGTGPYPLA